MTIVTLENAQVGMYVHEAGILGNLRVQQITELTTILDDRTAWTKSLMPRDRIDRSSYALEGRYASKQLTIIDDPVAFIESHWLSEQALYIMMHDVNGLGQRIYRACAWMCANSILDHQFQRQDSEKITIARRRWQITDYKGPYGQTIRERRGWSKSDRLYNGKVVWGVVGSKGAVDELLSLVDCVRKLDLWFDDSRYLANQPEVIAQAVA